MSCWTPTLTPVCEKSGGIRDTHSPGKRLTGSLGRRLKMRVGQGRVRQREAGSGARSGGPKEETASEWDRESVVFLEVK